MSKKDGIIIKPSNESIASKKLQSDAIVFYQEKRQNAIQILREIPAFVDIAKKLLKDKTYHAVLPSEIWERIRDGSARLDKKDNGLFGALVRDVRTGRVIDHVDLREVKPEVISSLCQLAIQQTLADILNRLETIDEQITAVLQGQVNDRLAEVESGIDIYEQAVVASDPDLKRQLMGSAIQKLNDGRNKLLKSTDFSFIDKLPRNKWSMFFSKHSDIPKYVQSKAETVLTSYHAIIQASRYLVLAYSYLQEPDSLRVSLEQVQYQVELFQHKISEMVNWLPPTSDLHESLNIISRSMLPNIRDLDDASQKTIIIEFYPHEIMPPEGDYA